MRKIYPLIYHKFLKLMAGHLKSNTSPMNLAVKCELHIRKTIYVRCGVTYRKKKWRPINSFHGIFHYYIIAHSCPIKMISVTLGVEYD